MRRIARRSTALDRCRTAFRAAPSGPPIQGYSQKNEPAECVTAAGSVFVPTTLHKSEIELALMHVRVGGDVEVAEIVLDLFEDLAFTVSKRFRDVRMYP